VKKFFFLVLIILIFINILPEIISQSYKEKIKGLIYQLPLINVLNKENIKLKSDLIASWKLNLKTDYEIYESNQDSLILFDKKYLIRNFETNDFFPAKKSILPYPNNTQYLEIFKNNLLVASKNGFFSYTKLKNFSKKTIKFKKLNSNILKYLNDESLIDSWFGITDIYIDENFFYVSFINDKFDKCYNTAIVRAKINFEFLDFKFFYNDKDCINSENINEEFNAHQAGGRIVDFRDNQILLSIGEYRHRNKSQDYENNFGKIIAINKKSNSSKIISLGHRNVQGLFYDNKNDIIMSTEHGPFGGDEINFHSELDSIYNFGWPISSYGYHYVDNDKGIHDKSFIQSKIQKNAPLYKSHLKYRFTEPLKFFTPSIAISEIVLFDSSKNNNYKILVGSMGNNIDEGDLSLYSITLDIDSKKIIKISNYNLDDRIRDMKFIKSNNFIFLSLENKFLSFIDLNL
jgi:hypothetical protein